MAAVSNLSGNACAMDFISVDQNCLPLWDVAPKLAALRQHGWRGTHFIEDIDAAFSRHGAVDEQLTIAPESYYRDGTADWGAAAFYFEFLGRSPLDVRELEKYTGLSSVALAKKLNCSLTELYARFSASDNQQLIGASYFNGDRTRHRVLGDLSTAEILPFIENLLARAEQHLAQIFVEPAARQRLAEWRAKELSFIQQYREQPVTASYRDWLKRDLGAEINFSLASQLFALTDNPSANFLLASFLRDYGKFATWYNEAVTEFPVGVKPLTIKRGELPFFAIFHHNNRWWREPLFFTGDKLQTENLQWEIAPNLPIGKMRADNIAAITPKAILLVLQVRLTGAALVLPEQGSLYMPAAYALQKRLLAELPIEIGKNLPPVLRVRLHLFERMRECSAKVLPPSYLREILGDEITSAAELVEKIAAAQIFARTILDQLQTPSTRLAAWQKLFPADYARRAALEEQRRICGQNTNRRHEAAAIWDEIRGLDLALWNKQIVRLTEFWQLLHLDYFNWRGAIYPQALALGGEDFYRQLLARAEIVAENPR